MKVLRVGKKFFLCKSVNVLSKLLIAGFVPAITKQSEFHDGVWIWYFDTTDELLEELKKIFEDCDVVVMD